MNKYLLVISLFCLPGVSFAASCDDELPSHADSNLPDAVVQHVCTDDIQRVRNEALRHAAATRDIASLERLLRRWTFEDLKLVAVTVVRYGYCAGQASSKLKAIFMDRRIFQDRSQDRSEEIHGAAFWQALKDGHFDTARDIEVLLNDNWDSMLSLSKKAYPITQRNRITADDIYCYVSYLHHIYEWAWHRLIRGMSRLDARRVVFNDLKRVVELTSRYFLLCNKVGKILRSHCISLYLLLFPGSELFNRKATSILHDNALARLLHRLRVVSHRIDNPDLMGIVCDYVDPENSRWLKLLSEFSMPSD